MAKIFQNLGGGLDSGYKIFEHFLENWFCMYYVKIFSVTT